MRASLLQHYGQSRRDLPWRGETDPYRVWVSEVMLQQTRIQTVIPYYRRWIERFPDIDALARASMDEVLLAWRGLGYYRRAARLHEGARVVRDRWGGRLPTTRDALRALPGVGEYTAGAVASIAFGEPVPAVDGNVRRVLSRLFDEPAPTVAWLRRTAGALLDPEQPGDWNEALMDLGATVCTPRNPDCAACPWARWCGAHAAGSQHERPERARRAAVPSERFAVAVVADACGRVLLVRRPGQGLLAGLWAFPEEPAGEDAVAAARTAAEREGAVLAAGPGGGMAPLVARRKGPRPGVPAPRAARPLPPVRHRFTHLDATYHPVLLAGEGADGENRRWVPLEGRLELALPAAQEKIARAAEAALTED